MKKFNLHILTNFHSKTQADSLAKKFVSILDSNTVYSIKQIENSFQIILVGEFLSDFDSISQAAELTDRICSPWLMNFNRDENEIELQFSLISDVTFRESSFSSIQKATFTTTS